MCAGLAVLSGDNCHVWMLGEWEVLEVPVFSCFISFCRCDSVISVWID